MSEAQTTTDHKEIRKWVEERGGSPATVKATGGENDPGILRIDFPGYSGEEPLGRISWHAFFEKFDEQKLAFLHQDDKGGEKSRFCKFIRRD